MEAQYIRVRSYNIPANRMLIDGVIGLVGTPFFISSDRFGTKKSQIFILKPLFMSNSLWTHLFICRANVRLVCLIDHVQRKCMSAADNLSRFISTASLPISSCIMLPTAFYKRGHSHRGLPRWLMQCWFSSVLFNFHINTIKIKNQGQY